MLHVLMMYFSVHVFYAHLDDDSEISSDESDESSEDEIPEVSTDDSDAKSEDDSEQNIVKTRRLTRNLHKSLLGSDLVSLFS